ncbi:MAG: methyltransferase domain-containing protein [Candidatus Thiodiazotropha sp.]
MDESLLIPPAELLASNDAEAGESLERTERHSLCSMRFDLQWDSAEARHTDTQVSQKLNLWRDIFPPELEAGILDKPVGHIAAHDYRVGELIGGLQERDRFETRPQSFNRSFRKGQYVEPRAGRFYPKGFIAGTRGIYPEEMTPFRVTRSDEVLGIDLNHPLAQREMRLSVQILNIRQAGEEHGGMCHDIAELCTLNGPGMQARWQEQATDFFSDLPFARMSGEVDAYFYQMPRLVDHIDAEATRQISGLYGRLVPSGGRVLDLMSSWKSHLPDDLGLVQVTGLGMNREELEANPALTERLVHDLNLNPRLPFDDAVFDAIVCSVSVEYLIKPQEVFAEAARVLKPGGRFILTFSNRWFQPKVIHLWQDLHEFERMGLVLEYFLRSAAFSNLETWSLRGLPRPADDKYAGKMPFSDPVYAVWGEKT